MSVRHALIVCLFTCLQPFAAGYLVAREPAERLLDDRRFDQERSRLDADVLPSAVAEPDLQTDPASVDEQGPLLHDVRIEIGAPGLLADAEASELLVPFAGLPLGTRRMALLLRRIDARLVSHGWITSRARVESIDAATRTIRIAIVPGRVEAIRGHGVSQSGLARVFPVQTGDVLDQSALEQGIRQINRLRLIQAQVQVLPGEQVGGSVIDVRLQGERRLGASIALDNAGSPATGRGRVRAGLSFANVLGLYEDVQIVHLRSAHSSALLASVALPYGFDTWSLTASGSSSESEVGGFTLDTSARTVLLAWNRVLALHAERRDAIDLSVQRSRIARRIGPIELLTRRSTVVRAAWSRVGRAGEYQYFVEPSVSAGLRAAGADEDAAHLPDGHVHYQFVRTGLAAGLVGRPGEGHIEYALQANAQYARVGLPGGEQLYLGGFSSVRGFEEALMAGDRGHVLRAELRFPHLWRTQGAAVVPYLHLDHGAVRSAGGNGAALAGAGAGLRGEHGDLNWDVVISTPLHKPDGLEVGDWTVRFVVSCAI